MSETTQNSLPLARIKTIMKSSPDALQISQEAVFTTAKAVEFFIEFLAQNAYENRQNPKHKRLEYGDVSQFVHSQDATLEFLTDILPNKMKFKDAMERIRQSRENESDSD